MLKSLELAGFKSFADRTRFEFPEGVTAIVGPNGSGKSNVVDAVKWVLGTQSPRSLRGKEMTDVIFNGSADRRAVNTAEVSLTLANPEPGEGRRRLFDLDETEVRLTRRVYRSGEGEYLINGQPCRLRDFRELLAGTGMGSDGYSIIEQGRVDAALQASPLERRTLFEEAAGISRFRLKKREAMRRLERVEQNLLRLSDIVDEVEGRLRRVRAQAGKARRYREQTQRLKQAIEQLGHADWLALSQSWRRLDAEHSDLVERLSRNRSLIREQETRLEQAEAAAPDSGVDHADQTEQRLARTRDRLAQARSRSELERRRAADLSRSIAQARQQLVAIQKTRANQRTPEENDALAKATSDQADLDAALREAASAADGDERRVVETKRQLAERHSEIESLSEESRQLAEEQREARERSAGLVHSLEELRAQRDEATRQRDQAAEGLATAAAERDSAADRLLGFDRRLGEAQRTLVESRKRLAELHQRLANRRERLLGARHRLESLAAEQERLERLNHDIASLLTKIDDAPGVHGLVADVLHVDVDMAPLVEAALGSNAEHVVVDSGESLIDALVRRPQGLTTRAGFQWLESRTSPTALDQVDLSEEPGVMGRASDFVETDPRFAPLVRRLLGRTWFVDTLASASRLAASLGRGLRFVTLSGELLEADGSLVAGPSDDSQRKLNGRQRAEDLRAEIARLESESNAVSTGVQQLEQSIEQTEATVAETTERAAAQRAELAAAAHRAAALDERSRQSTERAERLGEAIATREQESGRLEERLQQLDARLRERQAALERHEAQSTDSARALRQAEASLAAGRARTSELQAAAERNKQLVSSLREEALAASGQDPRRHESEAEDASRRVEEASDELRRSDLAALRAGAQAATLSLNAERLARRVRQNRQADLASRRVRAEVAGALKNARAESEDLVARVAQVELRRQQTELERRNLIDRLREEHDLDITNAPTHEADPTPVDRETLRREVDTLRRQVQQAGPVSLDSLEELDELEGRFEQLSTRYDDLNQAKKSLVRLTNRINADSRELFLASFESVRSQFGELFSRLFGGGEADLVLVDGPGDAAADDPLEGGVEIVACPPGKELRNLSLLSGGEKTMTCVALLLALFRSKPSPFCLLDEVDAALDEANVGRFSSVLSEFLSSTQFLVVTHSKRTMAAAGTLYGVTMQESGVSKQVSVRFEEVGEDGRISLPRASSGRLAA